MGQEHLAAQIEQRLAEQEEIHAVVAEQAGKILLSGTVDSARARKRAAEIAASMAPNRQIVNLLEVEHDLPAGDGGRDYLASDEFNSQDVSLSAVGEKFAEEGITLDPSTTAQSVEANDDLDLAHP